MLAVFKQKITQQQDFEFIYRFYIADGSVIWLKQIITPVYENNQLLKLQGFLQDISEIKAVKE